MDKERAVKPNIYLPLQAIAALLNMNKNTAEILHFSSKFTPVIVFTHLYRETHEN